MKRILVGGLLSFKKSAILRVFFTPLPFLFLWLHSLAHQLNQVSVLVFAAVRVPSHGAS